MQYTSEKGRDIVELIEQGVFLHVAAQACGVTLESLSDWLAVGKVSPEGSPFFEFYISVMQARAVARSRAEMRVYDENALAWLLHGPGRSTQQDPGWSRQTEVTGAGGAPLKIVTRWGQQAVEDVPLLPERASQEEAS